MTYNLEVPEFLSIAGPRAVVDVRSPGEYSQGHIPGAISIPLFSDQERAEIGTLYVKTGREAAIRRGFEIALPKQEWYIETLRATVPPGPVLVHCWRGGLRSEMLGDLFSRSGWEVSLLGGGYKAYRGYIREQLAQPARVVILGGYTGSGKTELLTLIGELGEQVIDLERLASHKGSAFGGLGQPAQPTNEQFENNLFGQWSRLDHSKLIWMEDESRMIGRVTLPEPVFNHISSSPLILVDQEWEVRINRLVSEYAGFDPGELSEAVTRISERLGGTRTKEALEAIRHRRFAETAAIVLAYYDKAYRFSIDRRINKQIMPLPTRQHDMRSLAQLAISTANNNFYHGTDLS